MAKGLFPTEKFQALATPFYYYDTTRLDETLRAISHGLQCHENFRMHYAVKACAHPGVLRHICRAGLGADCVSGEDGGDQEQRLKPLTAAFRKQFHRLSSFRMVMSI